MAVTRTQAHTETIRLGYVALYRDELEQIVQAVAEVGEPTIIGPGFEASTADDLADEMVPEQLDFLAVRASRGEQRIAVTLRRERAEVELVEPDSHLEGVASRIRKLCRPHHRWYRSGIWTLVAAVFATILAGVASSLLTTWRVSQITAYDSQPLAVFTGRLSVVATVLAVGTLIFVLGRDSWINRKSTARLTNAYRADRPTFWRRNRDQIWITAASLLVGAGLGAVVNELMT